MRLSYLFTCLLVISASVYIPGKCTGDSSDIAVDLPKDQILSGTEDGCSDANPCQNGGTCVRGTCKCPEDYIGSQCEKPTWCTPGKCGYDSEVECTWDRSQRKGECRCKKEGYMYLPKQKKCNECKCGSHGKCLVVDDILTCKCDNKYALRSQFCAACDCGSYGLRCSFNSGGHKVCQCEKGFASRTGFHEGTFDTWCAVCDCGEHGKCAWDGDEQVCYCDAGYRMFEGKCVECDCGRRGICKLNETGEKICSCDYGYAELDGTCEECDCNYLLGRRFPGINCSFVSGLKTCSCPPGFEAGATTNFPPEQFCKDINECFSFSKACPENTICENKPGTYECKCRTGFRAIYNDAKRYGCADIDECADDPCQSAATQCVNSPGSFDCVCRDGFYATSSTYGSSYKPAYNSCYEIETQWRGASIALGVILSIGILGISCYIWKHKSRI